MGNGVSSDIDQVVQLKDELAQLEQSLETLTRKPQIDPILPSQALVHGVILNCKRGVKPFFHA